MAPRVDGAEGPNASRDPSHRPVRRPVDGGSLRIDDSHAKPRIGLFRATHEGHFAAHHRIGYAAGILDERPVAPALADDEGLVGDTPDALQQLTLPGRQARNRAALFGVGVPLEGDAARLPWIRRAEVTVGSRPVGRLQPRGRRPRLTALAAETGDRSVQVLSGVPDVHRPLRDLRRGAWFHRRPANGPAAGQDLTPLDHRADAAP